MPALNKKAVALLASISGVNMNTATATALLTVPPGVGGCVVDRIVVRDASVSLDTASYSFGFNDPDYDDIIADAVHAELTGSTLFMMIVAKAGAKIGGPGDILKVLMNTLQGVAATSTMEVFGYFF